MSANTGGPASEKTLLDEFAGQAMLAITISALSENTRTGYSIENPRFLECLSIDAYAHADAMLAEKARREADHSEDTLAKVDHSPDATKMIELEAANRELVEALDNLLAAQIDPMGIKAARACKNARAILAKHKGAK